MANLEEGQHLRALINKMKAVLAQQAEEIRALQEAVAKLEANKTKRA